MEISSSLQMFNFLCHAESRKHYVGGQCILFEESHETKLVASLNFGGSREMGSHK